MKISKNFELYEFTDSETAKALGITNTNLSLRTIDNIKSLVNNVLQPLRDSIGKPIKIISGYRCERLNAAVKGSKTSQHMTGQACDIKIIGMSSLEIAKKVLELGLSFDQLILYPSFVHISHSYNNRKQILYNKSYNGQKIAN